jgi:hypothetical protein
MVPIVKREMSAKENAMNLNINPQSNTWKRIKTQHIAVAAAAALAASAFIGGVAVQDRTSSPRTPSQQVVNPTGLRLEVVRNVPPGLLLYVVGSEAEAAALQASFSSAAQESETAVTRDIMVVDSSEDEGNLQIAQAEALSGGGISTTFVDLRR